jgi:DNA transformation protein
MFGFAGLYCDGLFIALVADDILYFKVDDSNRPDNESAGTGSFRPFPDKPHVIQYYEVPIEALENRDTLCHWAHKALDSAR